MNSPNFRQTAVGMYAQRTMAQPPKVILLDLKLPLVTGLEGERGARWQSLYTC